MLTLLAKGLSNAEIASELFLGEATIKTHVSNCLSKVEEPEIFLMEQDPRCR